MIDSYRLSLGDFEIAGSFVENTDYILIFWCIFFIATLISLLIILNMVIAVMGGTFGRVEASMQSEICRAKLQIIIQYHARLSTRMKNELISHKYLLSVDVDPEADPIEKDSEEKRLKDSIKELRNDMHTQVEGINRNIDALYDRLARQQERDMQRSIEITKQELENQE